jgi:hypothetical protein
MLLGASVTLGACGGGAGESVEARGEDRQPGRGDATSTSSVVVEQSTTTGPSAPPASTDEVPGSLCLPVVADVLLKPPTVNDVGWVQDEPTPEVMEQIASALPAALASRFRREIIERSERAEEPSIDEAETILATFDAVSRWARQQCPEAAPAWPCQPFDPEPKFLPIGEATDSDVPRLPATPEEALTDVEAADGAVELDRSDEAVLYGWVDSTGSLERTVQIDRLDSRGWTVTADLTCLTIDVLRELEQERQQERENFEVIGESIVS